MRFLNLKISKFDPLLPPLLLLPRKNIENPKCSSTPRKEDTTRQYFVSHELWSSPEGGTAEGKWRAV